MKLPFVVLITLATLATGHAQTTLPDSIASRFAKMAGDSSYVTHLNSLATNYLKTNPALSRRIAGYIIDYAPRIKFTRGYARALTIAGNSYWYEGVYEYAQNYYLLAARQYQSLHDTVGLSQVYNNVGEVNKKLGENKKALEYLLKSLELKKNDSTRDLTLYNIGELYVNLGDYKMATEYIDKSMVIASHNKNGRVIAYNEWTTARIKALQHYDQQAEKYFIRAIKRWKELGETRSLIQTYLDLAELNRRRGKLALSEQQLDEAMELASHMHVPDLRISTFLEYSRLDSAKGNYLEALVYLTRYNRLKDSVYNLLKAEQIARVQAIYETEMHEQENRQLRSERELRETQLGTQKNLITAVTVGLGIAGVLVWILFRQRRKILRVNVDLEERHTEIQVQKSAIEDQAKALQNLNDKLQELNKSLENRIDERTQQLRLQNEKLSDFAFINAHRLRAPVASIQGLINLLVQTDQKEFASILLHLKTCGDKLDEMTREMGRTLESAMISEQKD
ncbi:MAG: hypothetical protein ABJA70_00860 [Chryseolinea sp.]